MLHRVGVDFFSGLVILGNMILMAWLFGLADDTGVRILLTLFGVFCPLATLVGPVRSLRERWWSPSWYFVGGAFAVSLATVMSAGAHYQHSLMVLLPGVLLYSLPLLAVIWRLLSVSWLLRVVFFVIWAAAFGTLLLAVPEGWRWRFLWLPVPAVVLLVLCWAFVSHVLFRLAKRFSGQCIYGPLFEVFLMSSFLLPPVVAVHLVPPDYPFIGGLRQLLLLLFAMLFGSVLSTPLRRLLLDLGNLPSDRRA